nr:uncharacterized protein C2orf72 homolog isoform X2 [Pelodiscus sinensis]|eukprot:XP_025038652.1 uncharacterized protein C2orf72 homolog isoform X2 [Pelodiscus sinensis]
MWRGGGAACAPHTHILTPAQQWPAIEWQGQVGAAEPKGVPGHGATHAGAAAERIEELFPDAYKPGINPAMAMTQTQSGAKAGASNIPSQLIFFLCRASSLRGKQADIQKILKGVKKFSHRGPAALVGVIVQPKKEEAAEARKLMESLLQGAFPRHPCKRDKQGGKQGQELEEVEVEVEIFIPGQPRGKLAIMKAACRASEALQQRTSADVKQNDAVWISRATLFKLLGALCVACAGIIGSQYMNTSI